MFSNASHSHQILFVCCVSLDDQNSMFAQLPYLGLWFVVLASGGGADRLQSHGVLSTTATRKVMQLIGKLLEVDRQNRRVVPFIVTTSSNCMVG